MLWIDAICVNQSDLEERSRQVQKIGMIFGFTKRVIFWLGRPTAEAALLLETLSELETKSFSCLHEDSAIDDVLRNKLWLKTRSMSDWRDCNVLS